MTKQKENQGTIKHSINLMRWITKPYRESVGLKSGGFTVQKGR